MPFKCCVPSCHTPPDVTLHKFPTDEERLRRWCAAIGREELMEKGLETIRKYYRVCDVHFDESAKYIFHHNRTNLKSGSVPMVNIPGKQSADAQKASEHHEDNIIRGEQSADAQKASEHHEDNIIKAEEALPTQKDDSTVIQEDIASVEDEHKPNFYICGLHFEEQCYMPVVKGGRRLVRGAVPTILPDAKKDNTEENNQNENENIATTNEEILNIINQPGTDQGSLRVIPEQNLLAAVVNPVVKPQYLFKEVKIIEDGETKDCCRLCLKSAIEHKELSEYSPTRNLNYKGMLEYLSVDLNFDFYPNPVICLKCVSLLESAYDLKKTCIRSDRTLKKYHDRRGTKRINKLLIARCKRKPNSETDKTNTKQQEKYVFTQSQVSDTNKENTSPKTLKSNIKREQLLNKLLSQYKEKKYTYFDWGEPPYVCEYCGHIKNTRQGCQKHVKKHLRKQGEVESFYCQLCDSTYNNVNPAVHLNTHRKRKYQCSHCGRGFDNIANLNIHVKNTHLVPYKVCHICGMQVKHKDIYRHMVEKHQGKKRCNICNKLVTASSYPAHRRNHYSSKRKLVKEGVCHVCGKVKVALREHIKRAHGAHQKEDKYSCVVCQMSFSSKKRLLVHARAQKHRQSAGRVGKGREVKKKDEAGVCHHCGKYETLLNRHIRKEHERVRKYGCNVCNMSFYSEVRLRAHEEAKVHIKNLLRKVSKEERTVEGGQKGESKVDGVQEEEDVLSILVESQRRRFGRRIRGPFHCEVCSFTFPTRTKFLVHKKSKKHIRNLMLSKLTTEEPNTECVLDEHSYAIINPEPENLPELANGENNENNET